MLPWPSPGHRSLGLLLFYTVPRCSRGVHKARSATGLSGSAISSGVFLCSLVSRSSCSRFGKSVAFPSTSDGSNSCLVGQSPPVPRSRPRQAVSGDFKEGTIAFRMIHEPSGKPIKYLKGIETDQGFEEVPEEEIIKGYEHAKGHHVLINPEEIDSLKLEAKHTIDMKTFVDLDQIDSRYFEKPYYLLPDGDEADEGYTVLRDALAKTKKMAVGQLVMHGREHLVGITAHKKGLMLLILRYADELRQPEPYFEKIEAEPAPDAVKLAVDLIEQQSGKFEPAEDAE